MDLRDKEERAALYIHYLEKAREHARVFEAVKRDVSNFDNRVLSSAHALVSTTGEGSSPIAIAEAEKTSSPWRKRQIDKCQFAMQQANMYSGLATAVAQARLL